MGRHRSDCVETITRNAVQALRESARLRLGRFGSPVQVLVPARVLPARVLSAVVIRPSQNDCRSATGRLTLNE